MAEEDRAAIVEQVKANPDSAKSVLASKPQLGTIKADDKSVPIRFASGYALDDGTNLIVLSDEPLGFIGGSKQSKKGFDLTYAMISVKASGEGKGEIRPACAHQVDGVRRARARRLRQPDRLARKRDEDHNGQLDLRYERHRELCLTFRTIGMKLSPWHRCVQERANSNDAPGS
jgi:hypothetical protein